MEAHTEHRSIGSPADATRSDGVAGDLGPEPDEALRGPHRGRRPAFEVRPGRVTGFLGPNGSGKSTTLADPRA